ncbi:hypothetical protein C8Q79DRAFT_258242 [Trametes meyenii]|nr:hypothetical protein C8Q79DRAFT_258242 [Trametes meyenii]
MRRMTRVLTLIKAYPRSLPGSTPRAPRGREKDDDGTVDRPCRPWRSYVPRCGAEGGCWTSARPSVCARLAREARLRAGEPGSAHPRTQVPVRVRCSGAQCSRPPPLRASNLELRASSAKRTHAHAYVCPAAKGPSSLGAELACERVRGCAFCECSRTLQPRTGPQYGPASVLPSVRVPLPLRCARRGSAACPFAIGFSLMGALGPVEYVSLSCGGMTDTCQDAGAIDAGGGGTSCAGDLLRDRLWSRPWCGRAELQERVARRGAASFGGR